MAIAKKGLRKITVDKAVYFYKISRPQIHSNFNHNPKVSLHPELVPLTSRYFGLGTSANAMIKVLIFSEFQNAKLFIQIYTPLLDLFIDYKQFLTVSPKLIAEFIQKARSMGWISQSTSDLHLTFHHKNIAIRQPTIDELAFESKENTTKNRFNSRASRGNIERGMTLLDKALDKS